MLSLNIWSLNQGSTVPDLKIQFISVWSQKPKSVAWLLKLFFLGEGTPESYHKMQIVRELLSASCIYCLIFHVVWFIALLKCSVIFFLLDFWPVIHHQVLQRGSTKRMKPCPCTNLSIYKITLLATNITLMYFKFNFNFSCNIYVL